MRPASRLFQEAREARGLAYAIDSYSETYADTGVLGVFAGCAAEKAAELADVTANEIKALTEPVGAAEPQGRDALVHEEGKYGTVGVVARDSHGDVAAGTSTGGSTAKRWGRVGDSPLIGAGSYANNRACAVSCTVSPAK